MPTLITDNPLALRILMDADLYAVDEPQTASDAPASLPGEAPPKQEEIVKRPVSFNYLGENNKYFLILVDDASSEFCTPKTLEALTNILKAKQLELKDIALVNLAKHPNADFASMKAYFACSKVALFGINPAQIGLKGITSNQISTFDGVKVLATFNFAEMEEDVAKKRGFWSEMKIL